VAQATIRTVESLHNKDDRIGKSGCDVQVIFKIGDLIKYFQILYNLLI
jgi:hypothetical protein